MITNVYIDGFNLYYRAVQRTRFKWLDLRRMVEQMFPNDEVREIHYFTAPIHPQTGDVKAPQRQQTYWRALRTIPGLRLHMGSFRAREITRPVVERRAREPAAFATVRGYQEKRSDVNLAARLLLDACKGRYEQAVVVSNDADFVTPLTYVRDELNLRIILLNPDVRGRTQRQLAESVSLVKNLRRGNLRSAQLPERLTDEQDGVISKPAEW